MMMITIQFDSSTGLLYFAIYSKNNVFLVACVFICSSQTENRLILLIKLLRQIRPLGTLTSAVKATYPAINGERYVLVERLEC